MGKKWKGLLKFNIWVQRGVEIRVWGKKSLIGGWGEGRYGESRKVVEEKQV